MLELVRRGWSSVGLVSTLLVIWMLTGCGGTRVELDQTPGTSGGEEEMAMSEHSQRAGEASAETQTRDDDPAAGTEPGATDPETPDVDERLAEADALVDRACQLADEGRLAEALQTAQSALAIIQQVSGPDDERLLPPLELISLLYEDLGDYPAAVASRQQIVGVHAAKWRAGDWRIRDAENSLENLQGRAKLTDEQRAQLSQAAHVVRIASQAPPEHLNEAIQAMQQAIGVQIQLLGQQHREVASSIMVLGDLLSAARQWEEAANCYQDAMTIRTKVLGELHPDVGIALNSLGMLLESRAQYEQALAVFQRALRVAESAYGAEHPVTATVHNNLGGLLKEMDRPQQAREHYARALEIVRQAPGDRRAQAAGFLANLGSLLEQQRLYDQARQTLEESLAICRQIYDAPHPDTAHALNNLGKVAAAVGDAAAARKLYDEALAILREAQGERHPETLQVLLNCAAQRQAAGEWQEARALFEQALKTLVESYEPTYPLTANARDGLGGVLIELGEYAAAADRLDQALQAYREAFGETSAHVARVRQRRGFLLLKQGDYLAARQQLEAALRIREQLPGDQNVDIAETLDRLSQVMTALGEAASAVQLVERGLERLEPFATAEPLTAARLRASRAYARHRTGEFLAALAEYEEVLPIFRRELGSRHPETAAILNNVADLLRVLGEYGAAESLHREALEVRRAVYGDQHLETAGSLNNLGLLMHEMGDDARARKHLEAALSICEQMPGDEHPYTGTTLGNLCTVFTSMGDEALARRCGERAVKILRATLGERHLETAVAEGNLARALLNSQQPADAQPYLERAAETVRQTLGDQHPEYGAALLVLGYLHELLDDHATAAARYAEAYQVYLRGYEGRHANAALCLDALGTIYLMHGRHADAATCFERSLTTRRQILSETHPQIAASYHLMGTAHYWQGNPAESIRWVRKSLELSRSHLDLLSFAQSERQQLKLFRAVQYRLNDYLSLAQQTDEDASAAYEYVLAWKGSVFRHQQQMRLAAGDQEAVALMAALRSTASRLAALTLMSPAADQRDAWLEQLEELGAEREQLETRLADRSAAFRQTRPATAARLAQILPEDTVLVDFVEYAYSPLPVAGQGTEPELERRFAAFAVRRDRPVVRIELGPAAPINQAVEAWRRECQQGASAAASVATHAEELHRLVWQPLQAHVGDAATVLLSPDGVLARFPFAALPGSQAGSYLLEDLALVVLPVPADLPRWLSEDRDAVPQPSLLLVGDVDFDAQLEPPTTVEAAISAAERRPFSFGRLPGAAREIAEVESLFRQRMPDRTINVLSGTAATRQAFLDHAARHTVVHAATHGFFLPDHVPRYSRSDVLRGLRLLGDPDERFGPAAFGFHPGLLSGIAFAGANRAGPADSDAAVGVLTALELAAADLSGVDLLVLSACETGLGELAGGQGVLGLQRACQIAGVRTTVTSLWKVEDDATRRLMLRFYENLWDKSQSPSAALRDAQLWLMNTAADGTAAPQRRPPRAWVAFTVSGIW
jgi:CHAT domain-containing protein/Tfp pilus assembly protein PilF